jgi:hypothetical protein
MAQNAVETLAPPCNPLAVRATWLVIGRNDFGSWREVRTTRGHDDVLAEHAEALPGAFAQVQVRETGFRRAHPTRSRVIHCYPLTRGHPASSQKPDYLNKCAFPYTTRSAMVVRLEASCRPERSTDFFRQLDDDPLRTADAAKAIRPTPRPAA